MYIFQAQRYQLNNTTDNLIDKKFACKLFNDTCHEKDVYFVYPWRTLKIHGYYNISIFSGVH